MDAIGKKRGFTATTLKSIAIFAMLLDHIAWAFLPYDSAWAILMHIAGRVTAPIMCYFLAEGYHYTRNVKKYLLRLAFFALISYFPFLFFEAGGMPHRAMLFRFNVIYTLLISLLALWVQDHMQSPLLRALTTAALLILSFPGDWMFFAVFYTLSFGLNRGNFRRQALWFTVSTAAMLLFSALPYLSMGIACGEFFSFRQSIGLFGFQAGIFLALPLLTLYNGQKGGGKYSKWAFYAFYPLHLTILGLIKMILLRS